MNLGFFYHLKLCTLYAFFLLSCLFWIDFLFVLVFHLFSSTYLEDVLLYQLYFCS